VKISNLIKNVHEDDCLLGLCAVSSDRSFTDVSEVLAASIIRAIFFLCLFLGVFESNLVTTLLAERILLKTGPICQELVSPEMMLKDAAPPPEQ
jgi:hypothetical protein